MEVQAFFNSPIQIPDEKNFWYFLIVFTTAFNLFFLNAFVPFNINTWRNDTQLEQLIHLSGFALLGGTVLSFSHLFIRLLRIRSFVLQTYLVRYFVELLIMSVVFVIYQEGQWLPVSELLKEVPVSFKYSFLSTILPYSMSFLLFNHLRMKEKKITYQEKLLTGMVDFPDEKNQIQFSICSDQITYIEAADNYLYIHCLENGQETRHLLRNTLKNMELHFAETGLKRCHRSFMVNLQRIQLVRYEKNKCLLYLNGIDQVIPVSRGYLAAFSEYIHP
ncbi:LytTR family DNA-binding domain-containing protein [Flavihumibacter sp. UBA7668]|uniref:LytTR family DNA-binding domain-containing protein n=1 Tax=Flavihumibacter sp. UBA7668 TaxID=1946542 RepID=UPI0025B906D2|nr:LytTR family DNA-binding domain-containing protein [Flavihumibacter sp. UBA7668]